jgi:hypothetical protein
VSTPTAAAAATTINTPKSSPLTKIRSPPGFFLNSSQILRSTFTRSTEKPLRAFQMSTSMNNNESSSVNRPSPRTRRLLSSSSDMDPTSISSPKNLRKPPSSYHHQKPLTNKAPLTTVLPSSSLSVNRKKSTSTNDLRKTHPMNSSVFQRLTQSKRL